MLTNVFLHLHPVSVRKSGIALSYTWCMGGLTFFLFLVDDRHRRAADVLLSADARTRLQRHHDLRDTCTLGILRELHRWGAHAMVITIWLHMYRVFLTGSLQTAARIQLGGRRHPAGADDAAVLHRLSAAVGSAGDLGHHRRQQHGRGHAASSATKARAPSSCNWAMCR